MWFAAVLGLACLVAQPVECTEDEGHICKSGVLYFAQHRDGATELAGVRRAAENLGDTDVLHYDLDIEIVPETHWLGGSNTITVRTRTDGAVHICHNHISGKRWRRTKPLYGLVCEKAYPIVD